jgi:hypothetical protein
MSLLEQLGGHFRSLFASWFPPLDEFPGAQGERAFLEFEVAKALAELGYAERALHLGLNGFTIGLADRRAKQEILSAVEYAIGSTASIAGKIERAVNQRRLDREVGCFRPS